MSVHDLRSMTWPAFKALDKHKAVAVLPLGAIEAHGPHLPLSTDVVIAEAMARAGAAILADKGFEVVVLPAIPVAPAPFAAGFEGTLDIPADTTTAILRGIAGSLRRAGVRVLAVANAHHDPAHVGAIRAAAQQDDGIGDFAVVFPDFTRRRWAARLTDEFQSGACHAGRYEGSIVLAAAPSLVDMVRLAELPPNPRSLVDAIRRGDTTFEAAGGAEAYFGWPADATAAEGHEIIERLGAALAEAVLEHERGKVNDRRERSTVNEDRGERLLPVNPSDLGRPVGFSHGVIVPGGSRLLYVAGQTAANQPGAAATGDFAAQFETALERVLAIVNAAGGSPADIARMTIYVTDLDAYRASRPALGELWRRRMGRHYPAMALVEVKGLVDRGAMVEIEADAALPPDASDVNATDRR